MKQITSVTLRTYFHDTPFTTEDDRVKQRLQEVIHVPASVRCMALFAGTQYEIKCRPTSYVLCNNFEVEKFYCKYFYRPATPIHVLNRASPNLITTTLTQSTSAQPPHAPSPPSPA